MKKIFFLFLIIISPMSLAELLGSDNVDLPDKSAIKFLGINSDNGTYIFEGKVKLKGLLMAGWIKTEVTDEGEIKHDLQLHFLPEKNQVALLPALKKDDYEKPTVRRIIFSNSSEESKQIVKQYFNPVPKAFFNYSEGVLEQPAVVTLDICKTFVECDSRYYYAELIAVEKISNNNDELVESSGCGTQYAVDTYLTFSTDNYVNLRAEPNINSKIIKQLPNDTVLEKIKTYNDWFYVKLYHDKGILGYVHKSQVQADN